MRNKAQHIVFILDRSGSMLSRSADVTGGFNTYIDELRKQAREDGLATIVSLITFSDDYSVVHAARPVADVKPLTASDYRAVGSTALLDAVYFTVSQYREKIGQGVFKETLAGEKPAVLVIVFTDGEENASRQATWQDVTKLISECEALGNWTFTYVGAHPGAWSQANQMHLKAQNVMEASDISIMETTAKLSKATMLHRANYRDKGEASTEKFFDEGDKS